MSVLRCIGLAFRNSVLTFLVGYVVSCIVIAAISAAMYSHDGQGGLAAVLGGFAFAASLAIGVVVVSLLVRLMRRSYEI